MVVLGVDPGFHITGFAILKKDQGKAYLIDYGSLKMKSVDHLSTRAGQFYNFFKNKIETLHVTVLALETPFLGKNTQTFLKLGYLRGILYLLANQYNLTIYEFAPREVKATVTGFGGAGKDQVASVIFRLFPKIIEFGGVESNDVSDAMAVCLCGFWGMQKNIHLK